VYLSNRFFVEIIVSEGWDNNVSSAKKASTAVQTTRAFRLVEASLTLFFFLTAARTVVAVLLGFVTGALAGGVVNLSFVNVHLFTAAAAIISWVSPRPRSRLPAVLGLSALVVAIARVPMTFAQPSIRFYAALVAFAAGGIYVASLIRASYRTLLAALVVAVTFDQLVRAAGFTYDISLREDLWLGPQIGLSLLAIAISRVARARASHEPFEPANLTLWNGLSFGAFLFLEMALLGMPNVIARWAGVDYRPVALWLVLASALSLSPALRRGAARLLELFDERMRGWAWILLLALLVVLGNRVVGPLAAVTLIAAQVVVLMLVWWVPGPREADQPEQVGPAITFGLAFYVILSYVYLLIFEDARVFLPLQGQSLTLHLVAVIILGVVLIGWRDPDPWHLPVELQARHGLPLAFAFVAFIAAVIVTRPQPAPEPGDTGTLRAASFDIHYGYGPDWRYDLEQTARSIEVAAPDVVALQRVDAGRQASYGVDQALWLGRRLGMGHVYYPTIEGLTGLAILSRWPIEDQGGVLLPSDSEQMGVAYALVRREPATRAVGVYSARLAPDDAERLNQVGGLLGYIGNTNVALLAGDLYLTPGGEAYTQLTVGNLSDPNATLNIVQDYTFPSINPNRRLDYVLLRGLTPIESQKVCGPAPASDHCLIVIEALRP